MNQKMTMASLGIMAVGVLMLIVVYTIIPVIGYELDDAVTVPAAAKATGTLSLTGATSDAELINVTTITGKVIRFELNKTGTAAHTAANIEIVVTGTTAAEATTNITTAMNANVSITNEVVVSNPTSTSIKLTSKRLGTAENAIATSENGVNMAWGAATLNGGTAGSNWSYSKNNNIVTGVSLWASLAGILKVGGIIVVVGGFLGTLRGLRQ